MTRGRPASALVFLRRAGLIFATGTGAGFASLGAVLAPVSIVGALMVGALAGLVGFALVIGRAETTTDQHQLHRRALHTAGVTAGGMALAGLALVGMAIVLGVATAPVLIVGMVAVAPSAWARFSSRTAPGPGPGGRDPDSVPPTARPRSVEPARIAAADLRPAATGPEALTTLGLCGQWQRSYFALTDVTDTLEREQLAALRRGYLDELERRDPAAVARWLAAEARPAGTSPARHLSPAPALSPTHRPTPLPGPDPHPGVKP